MGIFPIFVAEEAGQFTPVSGNCDPVPQLTYSQPPDGRRGPVPFTIPLTGIDSSGDATTIKGPPGRFKRLKSGATVNVGDRFFSRPNVVLRSGAKLNYDFNGAELHNLTLANGPVGIGTPNLNGARVHTQRFGRPGVYRFFCALHPTQMQERVIVKKKRSTGATAPVIRPASRAPVRLERCWFRPAAAREASGGRCSTPSR